MQVFYPEPLFRSVCVGFAICRAGPFERPQDTDTPDEMPNGDQIQYDAR